MADKEQVYRLLYFSGTGNTEYVACEMKSRLLAKGYRCEILAVDKLWADCGRSPGSKASLEKMSAKLKEFLQDASVLILAYPTYASDIPKPLKELLPLLPEGRGKKLAVVSTCAMAGGDCCLLPARELKNRGYRSFLAAYIKMPNNLKLPPFNFPAIENGDVLNKFYETSSKTIDVIISDLIAEKKKLKGGNIGGYLLGVSQRLGEKFLARFLRKNMFAGQECIKCKLCVSSCPTANISFKDGHPEFGLDCCFCMRCYNFCPVSAIQVTQKTRDKVKYLRYKGFGNWKPPHLRDVREVI